jgi:hypothetical protein
MSQPCRIPPAKRPTGYGRLCGYEGHLESTLGHSIDNQLSPRWRSTSIPDDLLPVYGSSSVLGLEDILGTVVFSGQSQHSLAHGPTTWSGLVSYVDDDLKSRFSHHFEKWKDESEFESSTERIVLNPSYQKIIGMGPVAVPFILEELRENPCWLIWALNAIVDENPVPEEHFGDLETMAKIWVEWGVERAIIPANRQDKEGLSWTRIVPLRNYK